MIKIFYLLWTFLFSVLVTSLSYFYSRDGLTHGFPFTFAKDILVNNTYNEAILNSQNVTVVKGVINYWLFSFDIIFWWLLFSILLVMVKNYVLEDKT